MRRSCRPRSGTWLAAFCLCSIATEVLWQGSSSQPAAEVAIPTHPQDGEEFNTPVSQLISYGSRLFTARFTIQADPQDDLIEFLKSLQVLPSNSTDTVLSISLPQLGSCLRVSIYGIGGQS
jgi:hypothetical protein